MNHSNQHSGRGVSVGALLLAAGAGAAVAWLARRADQRGRAPLGQPSGLGEETTGAPAAEPAATTPDGRRTEFSPVSEREIDEELVQTFPASDPLPHSHRVD